MRAIPVSSHPVQADTTEALLLRELIEEIRGLRADLVLRDELANGLAQFLDPQFVDPAVAAVANVSPDHA